MIYKQILNTRLLILAFCLFISSFFANPVSASSQLSTWGKVGVAGGVVALANIGLGAIGGIISVATAGRGTWFLNPNTQVVTPKYSLDRDELRYRLDTLLSKRGFRWVRSNRRAVKEELFVDAFGNIVQIKIKRGNKYRIRLIEGRNSTLGEGSMLASANGEPSIPERIWREKQAKDQINNLQLNASLTTNKLYLVHKIAQVMEDMASKAERLELKARE